MRSLPEPLSPVSRTGEETGATRWARASPLRLASLRAIRSSPGGIVSLAMAPGAYSRIVQRAFLFGRTRRAGPRKAGLARVLNHRPPFILLEEADEPGLEDTRALAQLVDHHDGRRGSFRLPRLGVLHRTAALRRARAGRGGAAREAGPLPPLLHRRARGSARRRLLVHLPQAQGGRGRRLRLRAAEGQPLGQGAALGRHRAGDRLLELPLPRRQAPRLGIPEWTAAFPRRRRQRACPVPAAGKWAGRWAARRSKRSCGPAAPSRSPAPTRASAGRASARSSTMAATARARPSRTRRCASASRKRTIPFPSATASGSTGPTSSGNWWRRAGARSGRASPPRCRQETAPARSRIRLAPAALATSPRRSRTRNCASLPP